MSQTEDFSDLTVEDDLLFWNGYLVSTAYSKLNSQQVHIIAAICFELIDQGINPEEYFSMGNLETSYLELAETLKRFKSNN